MEFLGILIVIALIGFVIYKIWDANEQVKFEKEQEQWLRAIIDKHPSSVPHPSTAHPKTTSTTPPTTTQRPASCIRRPSDPILTSEHIDQYINRLENKRTADIVSLIARYHRRMLSHITSKIVQNEDLQTWAYLWGIVSNYLIDRDILLSFDAGNDVSTFLQESFSPPVFSFIRSNSEFYYDYFYFDDENGEFPPPRCLWIVPHLYNDGGKRLYNSLNSGIVMKSYAAYCDILINHHFALDGDIFRRYKTTVPTNHSEIYLHDFARNVAIFLLDDTVSFCKELDKFQAKWGKNAQRNDSSTHTSSSNSCHSSQTQKTPNENSQFKRNSQRLLSLCLQYATEYEKHNTRLVPSCIPDLKASISKQIEDAKEEIAEWEDYDTDYDEIAHSMLAHTTFDLLASGQYHLSYGVLNPMNCSSNLMTVYKKVMEWGVANDQLTEDVREEQYRYLLQRISRIG